MTNAILKNGYASKAGIIVAYNYDAVTGEYTGNSDEFLPLGVGLPAYSTEKSPPDPKAGFAVVFSLGGWRYVADHRGETVYSTVTGQPVNIDYLGEIAEGFTTTEPSTPFDKWDGSNWVTDTNAQHSAEVASAQSELDARMQEADAIIAQLERAVKLGMATDDEKARLTEWEKYSVLLSRINPENAPKIDWPPKPE